MMSKTKRIVIGTIAVGVLSFGSMQTTQAAFMDNIWDLQSQGSVNLDTVIGQDLTLKVGDKLFYDETWFSAPQAIGGALLPSAGAIDVSASVSSEGYFGLQFNIVGFQANSGQAANFNLTFDAVVYPGATDFYISDVHMDLIGGGAAGNGNASITEAVSDASGNNVLVDENGNEVSTLFVVANDLSFDKREDWAFVDPFQKSVSVVKDIGVTGGVEGSAKISIFTQHFSQIPEPATVALLALGGVTMIAGRRRKA